MTHDQRIERKRKINHQCIQCGVPVHVGVRCEEHRAEKNRNYQRNYILNRLKILAAQGVLSREEILKAVPKRHFTSDPA
jgi:predicted GIY-YIG superfamily endonuclease